MAAEQDCECWSVPDRTGEELLAKLRTKHRRLVIQLVSMREAPNPLVVSMIGSQTLRAAEKGRMLAQHPEMDLLLRLAGTRQIGAALETIGYKKSGRKILIALGGRTELASLRAWARSTKTVHTLRRRELSQSDLDLVERAALLASEA